MTLVPARRMALTIGSTILLSTAASAHAQSGSGSLYDHGPGMMWGGGFSGGFGMIFGLLFMVLLLAALVAAIVLVFRAFGIMPGSSGQTASSDKALDILKERFARGEIDNEEFEQRKKALSA